MHFFLFCLGGTYCEWIQWRPAGSRSRDRSSNPSQILVPTFIDIAQEYDRIPPRSTSEAVPRLHLGLETSERVPNGMINISSAGIISGRDVDSPVRRASAPTTYVVGNEPDRKDHVEKAI